MGKNTLKLFLNVYLFSCGVDQYLFKTPNYADDLQTAFLVIILFMHFKTKNYIFRNQMCLNLLTSL